VILSSDLLKNHKNAYKVDRIKSFSTFLLLY